MMSQNTISSQPVLNPSFKQIAANNLIATPTPSMINSSILTLPPNITFAPAGAASTLIAPNSSPFIFRNQSDQMFIQTSSTPQISGAPIYFNQSGVHVVSSNATPSITVASSQSNTATNTTQSLPISPQLPMIGSTSSSHSTKVYKPLRPASSVLTAAAATQTSSSFAQHKQTDQAKHPTLKPKPQSSSKAVNHAETSPKAPGREATTQTTSQQTLAPQAHPPPSSQPQSFSNSTSVSSLSTTNSTPSTVSIQTKQSSQSSQFTTTTSQTINTQASFPLHSSTHTPHISSHSQQLSKSVTLTLVSQASTQGNSFHDKPSKSSFPKSDAANQTHEKSVSIEAKLLSTSQPKEVNTEISHKILSSNKARVANEEKASKKEKMEKKFAFTENDGDFMPNFIENSLKGKGDNLQNKTNGKLNDIARGGNVKNQPQKAIVKPQVLTHVIDGYVIHESPSPFPLNGLQNSMQLSTIDDGFSEPPSKRLAEISNTDDSSINNKPVTETTPHNTLSAKVKQMCENCGKVVPKSMKKNKKTRKFCSNMCAKKFAVNKPKKLDVFNPIANISSSEKEASTNGPEANLKSEINNKGGEKLRKSVNTSSNNVINNNIQLNNTNLIHNNNKSPIASSSPIESVSIFFFQLLIILADKGTIFLS